MRKTVTDAMRETARERAFAYIAARGMSTAEVSELAVYHARQARVHGGEARATSRMLSALAAKRAARTWFVAPQRSARARRRAR
jgi:hypothetical protein